MKLGTFIIISIFVHEPAIAQEMALKENLPVVRNEQAIAPQSQTDHYPQVAYAAPADRSIIELYALVARKKFTADPNLYSEIKQTDRPEAGIIEDWREQVFKVFEMHAGPRRSDLVNDNRLQSNNELDEQANESRMATRIVLKETLKFTQERLPEIDRLVKALRVEVSTDMVSRENAEAQINDKQSGEARAAHHTVVKDTLLLKTGLRVPVESGKLGVVSETEARFGNMSSFFKVYLDGQYDNSAGIRYTLARDIHLQVERQVTHTTDLVMSNKTNAKSNLNLIQLVCKF